jgi:hypothetical protein
MGNLDTGGYTPFVHKLKHAMERIGERRILDLCSGGAGPIAVILRTLEAENFPATAVLTDLYPNPESFRRWEKLSSGRITWRAESVDATAVPRDLSGFRLLCNAFHHFRPAMAKRILADAVESRRGIAIVEVVSKDPAALLSIPIAFLALFLVTPFLRPFRLSRLLFTYVIPLVPLLVLWDGIVSCLRVYSPKEMAELTKALDYEWDFGRLAVPKTPMRLSYLIGTPKK